MTPGKIIEWIMIVGVGGSFVGFFAGINGVPWFAVMIVFGLVIIAGLGLAAMFKLFDLAEKGGKWVDRRLGRQHDRKGSCLHPSRATERGPRRWCP